MEEEERMYWEGGMEPWWGRGPVPPPMHHHHHVSVQHTFLFVERVSLSFSDFICEVIYKLFEFKLI